MSEWKTTKETALLIIHRYKQFECLWNSKIPEYKRVDLKRNAWRQLADKFDRDVDDLKKKIKYLRSVYVSEKRKVEESTRTASSPDDIYKPHLFYFDDFKFLDPTILPRKRFQRPQLDNAVEVEETVDTKIQFVVTPYSHTLSPSPVESNQQSKRGKRAKPSRPNHSKPDVSINDSEPTPMLPDESTENIYAAFGKTISLQLAQMNPLEATRTMDKIHRLVSKNVMRSLLAKTKSREMSTANGKISPVSISGDSDSND